MSDHKYKLKYELKTVAGEFTADELRAEKTGGTDALFVMSVIYPEDGSLSTQFYSFDGRKGQDGELDDNELFKVWSLLGTRLEKSDTLGEVKREVAAICSKTVREVIFGL